MPLTRVPGRRKDALACHRRWPVRAVVFSETAPARLGPAPEGGPPREGSRGWGDSTREGETRARARLRDPRGQGEEPREGAAPGSVPNRRASPRGGTRWARACGRDPGVAGRVARADS